MEKTFLILMIALAIFTITPAIVASKEDDSRSKNLTLFEFYNGADNNVNSVVNPKWEAQTFTPLISHKITKIKIKVHRLGFPGIITVGIRATNSEGKPIGGDLAFGSIDGNTFTDDVAGAWYTIDLRKKARLQAGTRYAIVLGNNTIDGWVRWHVNTNSDYDRGNSLTSFDSGKTWVFCDGGSGVGGTYDALFEEWGKLKFYR